MIGGLLGIVVGWTYLSSSWQGVPVGESVLWDFGPTLIALGGCLLVGLLLIPRTIGMMFTPAIFIAPFAFIIGWVKTGFLFGFAQLILGIAAWGITVVISKFRPSSV